MSYRGKALLSVALLVLALAVAPSLYAQAVNTGTIVGQVTDPSSAAVAGATVTLTDVTTNTSRSLQTNADGRYVFPAVPPGTYDLTVTAKGFRESKVSKSTVTVQTQLTLNVQLQIGVATEVVEVVAGTGAELQTLNSTVGTTFNQLSIDALPAIGRDVSSFATLQAGVDVSGAVAGAMYDQNTYQLDGGQNTNDMDGSMTIYTPSPGNDASGVGANCFDCYGGVPGGVMPTPIDSIEEFKVNTTQQTADFNSSAGAQVSMVTRRGHDSWHGTAYEYYLDNNWNANSFPNDALSRPIPSFHYNRFGGAGGGPIIPKKILGGKTYFFGNYEGFRYPNSVTLNRDVPGFGMRQGLLAFDTCTANCGTKTEVDTPMVYNLQPGNVTYNGPTINYPKTAIVALSSGAVYSPGASLAAGGAGTAVAACPTLTMAGALNCDPRNLGISPTMTALWNLMPEGNLKNSDGTFAKNGGYADGVNVLAFNGNVTVPTRSDFAVARIDHDFGDKEHFFSTYRFYRLTRGSTVQTDLLTANGGSIVALANRPQIPWFFAAGLTSNITSNFTNDFHYSYLRNWWLWGDIGGPNQGLTCGGGAACNNLTGLGGALEPGGDTSGSSNSVLSSYNVNNQATRQRYWDGQDHMLRDDMTRLLGNHLLQWGGSYQHNYNQHSRDDNGVNSNVYPTYVLSDGIPSSSSSGVGMAELNATGIPTGGSYTPAGVPLLGWNRDYANLLGLLSIDQYVATRKGPQLTIQPPLTPITDKVTIPYYNVYFMDSWKIRPTITLTYGLAWTLEMPPVEATGQQVLLVDQANQEIKVQDYLNTRRKDALNGVVFNPQIGYSLVGNAAGGQKYPYNPYYGEFAPRVAVAWSPNFDKGIMGDIMGRGKTVVRGGFSVIYGRLNGVDLVLVPLLGYGLLQPVQCFGPVAPAAQAGLKTSCAGSGITTPANAFRIGPGTGGAGQWDGLVAPLATPSTTLPQPAFPGINSLASGDVTTTDPNFRPNKSYEMDFTVQRQITPKVIVEAGYIGRIIRNEFQPVGPNAIPYMFTEGGQQFQKAYANLVMQYCGGVKGLAGGGCNFIANVNTLTPQPFFETALGGAGSKYCSTKVGLVTPTSCTAAVALNEGGNGGNLSTQAAWYVWSDLDAGPFQPDIVGGVNVGGVLSGPTMMQNSGQLTSDGIGVNASVGYGNYNALFITTRIADWHGLTLQSNFTYGKALGTGSYVQASSAYTEDDPFDTSRGYGPQAWDRKFLLNTFLVYQPAYYKNQQGVIGHLLGGWSIAPILTAGSGNPLFLSTYSGADFGASGAASLFGNEQAVPVTGCSFSRSTSRHDNVPGSNGIGVNGAFNLNLYANPSASFNCFRNPVLGFDNGHNGGLGNTLRGQPFWNVDIQIKKTTRITERVSVEFQVIVANVFNHAQFFDPSMSLSSPGDWGALEGQENTNRQFEFGGRIRF